MRASFRLLTLLLCGLFTCLSFLEAAGPPSDITDLSPPPPESPLAIPVIIIPAAGNPWVIGVTTGVISGLVTWYVTTPGSHICDTTIHVFVHNDEGTESANCNTPGCTALTDLEREESWSSWAEGRGFMSDSVHTVGSDMSLHCRMGVTNASGGAQPGIAIRYLVDGKWRGHAVAKHFTPGDEDSIPPIIPLTAFTDTLGITMAFPDTASTPGDSCRFFDGYLTVRTRVNVQFVRMRDSSVFYDQDLLGCDLRLGPPAICGQAPAVISNACGVTWGFTPHTPGGPTLTLYPHADSLSVDLSAISETDSLEMVVTPSLEVVFLPSGTTVPPGSGSGCPFLFTGPAGAEVIENNILPDAEFFTQPPSPSTDSYRLTNRLVPSPEGYRLQIRELDQDQSYLDHVQLIRVDHPLGTRVVSVPDRGRLICDSSCPPSRVLDENGVNWTGMLATRDDQYYEGHAGDQLTVTFSGITSGEPNVFHVVARQKTSLAPSLLDTGTGIRVQVRADVGGREIWKDVARIHPRARVSDAVFSLPEESAGTNESRTLRLTWVTDHELDWIGIETPVREAETQHHLALLRAEHVTQGSVLRQVTEADAGVAEVGAGESLELLFSPGPAPLPGTTQDFFFVTRGYYVHAARTSGVATDSDATVSSRSAIQVGPNPVSGSSGATIEFSLPEHGLAALTIYDAHGRVVRDLLKQQWLPGGDHPVRWDARDNNDESVPPGVYFAVVRRGSSQESKKLTIVH